MYVSMYIVFHCLPIIHYWLPLIFKRLEKLVDLHQKLVTIVINNAQNNVNILEINVLINKCF